MAVKSTTTIHKESFKEYPKLRGRFSENIIVLFTSPQEGTVVYTTGRTTAVVGEHRSDWLEYLFKDYYGEITLRNS